MAGVSRSATIVIAHLMKSRDLPFYEAFQLVKSKRKIVFCFFMQIHPNDSFLKQLQAYGEKLRKEKAERYNNRSSSKENRMQYSNVRSVSNTKKQDLTQSTSSSWFPLTKSRAVPVVNNPSENQYDKALKSQIQRLFLSRKS